MAPPRVRLGDLSVGFVQPLVEALLELGHDPQALLLRYGLDEQCLGEPQARLSIPRYMHLGHAAIELSGDPALGLRMGRLSRLPHAGLAGVAAAQAPNLGEAARTLLRFEPLYAANYRGRCRYQKDEHGAWLCFYSISPYNAYNRFVVDSLMGGWLAQLSSIAAEPVLADRLEIEFEAPDYAHCYEALCASQVLFGARTNRLHLPRETLGLRNAQHCPGTWRHLLQLCEAQLQQRTRVRSLSESILHLLGPLLSGGQEPTLEEVARRLQLPPWTLRRRLADEGTRFRNLLNDARRDLAEAYIRDTELSFSEIAYLLGFASAEAFQRAFKRWTSLTPGEYRRTRRQLS
ncbi:AraC family transcriptional regulator [Pseudomonas sp. Marseille-QA0332]